MKYFIVFCCPVGSATWTIAYRDTGIPAYFMNRPHAEEFCVGFTSVRKAWMNGKPDQVRWETFIAEVDLPERAAERAAAKLAYENRNA